MKIYRNGVEIELTEDEIYEAHQIFRNQCDVEDILNQLDYDENEFMDDYGISLNDFAVQAAEIYRSYMDSDESWYNNASLAIEDMVDALKKED